MTDLKSWSVILTASLICACGSRDIKVDIPDDQVVIVDTVFAICGQPPERDPVAFRQVEFIVLPGNRGKQLLVRTEDDEIVAALPEGDRVIALTPEEYENLSYNTSEMIIASAQQRNEIEFYEDCIRGFAGRQN